MSYKHTQETRTRMSVALAGRKVSPETRIKMGLATRGRRLSIESRDKISATIRGERHWNWQGGITKERQALWNSGEYKFWRSLVFERDDYTCQYCFERGGRLEAHHIKSFAKYPELGLDVSNGITLCKNCHRKVRT